MKDKIGPFLFGAFVGAVGLALLGFSYFGWETANSAKEMADDAADAAKVTALAPLCVEKALADPDAPALILAIQDERSSYRRRGHLKTEWTGDDASNDLKDACAEQLAEVDLGTLASAE